MVVSTNGTNGIHPNGQFVNGHHKELPASQANQVYCQASALDTGLFSLPERDFLQDGHPTNTFLAPSMSFLIRHPTADGEELLLFDLGLRRDISSYLPALQPHLETRRPFIVEQEAKECLMQAGSDPKSVAYVILSHVHWDHIGQPSDYPQALHLVGSGSLHLLQHGQAAHGAGHFDPHLFDGLEVRELPQATNKDPDRFPDAYHGPLNGHYAPKCGKSWEPLGPFPNALDLFGDGSLYIIDAPGHLYGHINLLARIGQEKWVYLGGDAAHHPDLLSGARQIAVWKTPDGCLNGCVHRDKAATEETLNRIRSLKRLHNSEVEVILAHDLGWREANVHRFLPGQL